MRVALISAGAVSNVVIAASLQSAQSLFPGFECVPAKDAKIGGVPPIVVACYYFGGWKNPPEAQVTWFGSNVWANSVPNNKFMGDYPSHHPAEGDYDEDNQSVIDTQLRNANTAGIDVFLVDWYEERFHTHATNRIPVSTELGRMKWALMWANHYDTFDLPQNTRRYLFDSCLAAAVRIQNAGETYWRINNKPVFYLFSGTHLLRCIRKALGQVNDSYVPTTNERSELVGSLRRVITNYLAGDATGGISGAGSSAAVSGTDSSNAYVVLSDGDIGGWGQVVGVDAMSLYNATSGDFGGVRSAHTHTELRTAQQQNRDLNGPALNSFAPTKKWWPVVTCGWDKKPWGGSTDPLLDDCLPASPSDLTTLLADTKTYCLANANSARVITVYAWNEFGEGGFIAPSVLYGYGLMNTIRNTLGWAKT